MADRIPYSSARGVKITTMEKRLVGSSCLAAEAEGTMMQGSYFADGNSSRSSPS